MSDPAKAIEALKESRPPATDRFTYLTIIEQFLSPEILPALNEILQDAQLTQDIGWDLVDMLVSLPGCEPCLETIARLGNPREVILKVLEVLEGLQESYEAEEASPAAVQSFITLLGMLAILHKRIKTKYPSRFLASTLSTVYRTYLPNQEMTASVINLVRSLSAKKRPLLPSRKSSVNVANPDEEGDATKNAPDPEAETEDPIEGAIQQKLLLSFVTCIVESYVNGHSMEWSSRLLEFYAPERVVPGRKSLLDRFKEEEDLLSRDTMVGKLEALARDLGFSSASKTLGSGLYDGPIHRDPLSEAESPSKPDDVPLSTGGSICIVAYWLFSATVFGANSPKPDMHIFPDHFRIMQQFMEDDAHAQIMSTPGTIEAIISIGLWLQQNGLVTTGEDEANFMPYHHLLTLCGVYHPSIQARNAAITLAGRVLHDNPDEDDRVKILEDLLENCMFASLKACAVTWLREEIIAAREKQLTSQFSGPDAVDQLQYVIFPDMEFLRDLDQQGFVEYWAQNSPFLLQAANFAYLLLNSKDYSSVVPAGMGAAVGQRYVEPLLQATVGLESAISKGEEVSEGAEHIALDTSILIDRLKRLDLQ
ncbi:uncharacterized protein E0L32_009015 [Thyridium curvatum]|uniref:Uncharacterized protein n=1 Tax=Thyridium curvatum TaxID=1093900 RepID=A0A507ATK5_9PEZI|nr:uncharacterized protein E0L32_009015 [Thyridium curvatum]TPX09824.1 hypothetical protein E0L32_009015 [Thyridium curvatum]